MTKLKKMRKDLFKKDVISNHNSENAARILLDILSIDWIKGLISLKRSQILINNFGNPKVGVKIIEVIKLISKTVPSKYRNRYLKYFSSIMPLNNLLQVLSKNLIKSEFWRLDKEVCLTSLIARFEAVYAHIDNSIQTLLKDGLKEKNTIHFGRPILLRADDGSLVEVDKKFQQLAASLDRNLRFIEYHLKRTPLVNIATPPKAYEAGAFQIAGELWNSIFYLINKVSLFDWYATKISDNPETLYYQPRNKTEHIMSKIGDLRESQWLIQQFIDAEDKYKSIKMSIKSDDPFLPRNEKELRAYIEISQMCNDNRILDVEFKNGLKVKEYLRSWFVISELAKDHFNKKKGFLLESEDSVDVSNLLFISSDALISALTKKGKVEPVSAQKSIELMCYWNMDHDIFSSPLFPTNDGSYLILTCAFISGNPVRSIFRLLSHDEIDIGFKGISSEKNLENIFSRMGFKCLTGYKYQDSLGEGEIDCIAFKENIFFVCESKNIVPNESTNDRFRTLDLFEKKASKQANRGSRFINSHLSKICEQFSIKVLNNGSVRVYPFIITNLFGFTGLVINGVHVCDFSALERFAQDKYVYRMRRGEKEINKVPVHELYKGDEPTANDLLNQLHKPFQLEYERKKLKIVSTTQPMTKELNLVIFDVSESETASETIDLS